MTKRSDTFQKRQRTFIVPEQGIPEEEATSHIRIAASRTPALYASGEAMAKPGTVVDQVAVRAGNLIMELQNPNLIDPHMFLGAYELEREAIGMTAQLLGKQATDSSLSDGFFMNGGTESLMQLVWTYRNKYFFTNYGISVDDVGLEQAIHEASTRGMKSHPVILMPIDAHFAVKKAARLIGLGSNSVHSYGLDGDFKTDFDDLERQVKMIYESGKDIMLNCCVAGDTQKGFIQDTKAVTDLVTAIATRYGRQAPPTIVDAAAQYLFAAVMASNPVYDGKIPVWDFRVPAVDAIVADAHKNQIPYNASILLLRDMKDAKYTDAESIYLHKNLVAGLSCLSQKEKEAAQHNSTIPTSRGGYTAAGTWAYYQVHGLNGIRKRKEQVWTVTKQIANALSESKHYELLANPQTSIVAFRLKDNENSERYAAIYNGINEGPNDSLYISKSSNLQARTLEQEAEATTLAEQSPYTALCVHVMEHNAPTVVPLLISRLEEEAAKCSK